MIRISLFRICWIAFPFLPSFIEGTPKNLYIYDPADDCVKNKEIENPSYGTESWSYQQSNRDDNFLRARRFRKKDISGKSVMDFGCNEGGVLLACRALGASKVIGIEYNLDCINRAKSYADQLGLSRTQFIWGDIENKALLARLPRVDTVLLLAILDTSEFHNKIATIANVSKFARETLYYEGHQTQTSHVARFYDFLIATDFTRFEYLGKFEERVFLRFSRETMKAKQVPHGATTSDSTDQELLDAEEIYVYTDSGRNPPFGPKCRLIQFVTR